MSFFENKKPSIPFGFLTVVSRGVFEDEDDDWLLFFVDVADAVDNDEPLDFFFDLDLTIVPTANFSLC